MRISGVNPITYKNNKLSFKRSLQEHNSWGVHVGSTGVLPSAKIFTFPDAKEVSLLVNQGFKNETVYPLQNMGQGVFETQLPKASIKEGDKYFFVIEKANGEIIKVKDPYSFKQPQLSGASEVYNHKAYKWNDKDWFKSNNEQKISRNAGNNNSFKPVENALIYEINVATLTNQGDFNGTKTHLKRIKELGFNAIELMPVENTYSYNWGYDGVDKFAVSNFLGGPDKLKELIDEAHNVGLNVIMDMVPNHLGPDGAQLAKTGPYISGSTPWGDAFNYEGENCRYVRDFMVNAALNWLLNYHCDGLRLDMTKHMNSDNMMQQIAAEVNKHVPDAFLIAEDGRSNMSVRGDDFWHDWWQPHDQRVIIPLKPAEIDNPKIGHDKSIDKFVKNEIPLSRLGFDSEWDFHFYHTITKIAYGEADLDALERAIVESGKRVKYSTSHDETGNLDGTRLVAKYMVPYLKLSQHTILLKDDIQRARDYADMKEKDGVSTSIDTALNVVKSQKVQQNSMKLAQIVQNGTIEKLEKLSQYDFEKYMHDNFGIVCKGLITPDFIIEAFEKSVQKYRAIEALKYFTPGPVMTFQGEENIEMTKFNFFRQFESIKDEKYLHIQKGYPNGVVAYKDSIMGNNKYSKSGQMRMDKFQNLIVALNQFKKENPASTIGQIVFKDTIKHPQNPTIAMHSKDDKSKNETFMIANFSNVDYPVYEIEMPVGIWQEIINTNDAQFGGTNSCQNIDLIFGYGDKNSKSKVAIPAFSTLIFKKVK